MEKLSVFKTMLVLLFFIVFVLLSLLHTATSQELEDESGFSYDTNNMTNGPDFWGQIRPEWFLCGNGTMQSPIDLKNPITVTQYGELQMVYRPSFATLVNRGKDISLRWEDNPGYIQINGTRYNLEQCHWHTPSEHVIDGQRYDLENHCVHTNGTNRIAVVSTLYKIGLPDPLLTSLTLPLITLRNGAKEASAGVVNPRQIRIADFEYYRYIGSLTIPPCSENIVWTVFRKVQFVSRVQVKLLQEAVGEGSGYVNARPLQPLNDRIVLLYKPR